MSTRIHLDHEHWINLVDLYNSGRVCRVLVGCRGGFYGIVSKVLFLLVCFFLFLTACCWLFSTAVVTALTTAASPGIPRDVETFPCPYYPQLICRDSWVQEPLGQVAVVWTSLQFTHRSSTRGQKEKEKSCSSQGGLCPAHHRGFCKIPLYAKGREEKYT